MPKWVVDVPRPVTRRSSAVRIGLLVATTLVGLWIVAFRSLLLPTKFFYDSNTIQRLAVDGNANGAADDSFSNVASMYRVLGLEDKGLLAGVLGYALVVLAVLLVLRLASFAPSRSATAVMVFTVLLGAVYLGTYSKDVFVMPIVLMFLARRTGIKSELVLLAALLLYADVFRTYWFLVAVLYGGFRVLGLIVRRGWPLLVAPVVALVVLGVVFPLAFGRPSDFARADSNLFRGGSADAVTMIVDFVHLSEPWNSLVNTLLVLLTIFVPVPLLLRGGLYYVGIAVSMVGIWSACAFGLYRTPFRWSASPIVALLLAFVSTQALFEPDYGSMLRHLTPLLPLVCLVVAGGVRAQVVGRFGSDGDDGRML